MFEEPKITTLTGKKLVGHSIEMSLTNNKTFELFSGFMPNRKQIKNVVSDDVFEIMIYHDNHFRNFSPSNTFEKWASFEVSKYDAIPNGMKTLDLNEGLYAVFNYKGTPEGFGKLMHSIFTDWFPKSKYQLDNRPHFNVLGEKYKKNDPESEEAVWIPIKLK